MRHRDDHAADAGNRWYRQPIVWLGAVMFTASMAGCVWMIVLGTRHADQAIDAPPPLMGVPSTTHDHHPVKP